MQVVTDCQRVSAEVQTRDLFTFCVRQQGLDCIEAKEKFQAYTVVMILGYSDRAGDSSAGMGSLLEFNVAEQSEMRGLVADVDFWSLNLSLLHAGIHWKRPSTSSLNLRELRQYTKSLQLSEKYSSVVKTALASVIWASSFRVYSSI